MLPRGIAGQIILVVATAVVLQQALGFAAFVLLRPSLAPPPPDLVAMRIATAAQLLQRALPAERASLAAGASDDAFILTWPVAALSPAEGKGGIGEHIAAFITTRNGTKSRLLALPVPGPDRDGWAHVAVSLADGTWLGADARVAGPGPVLLVQGVVMLSVMAVAILVISLGTTFLLVQPLRRFAQAAEAFELKSDPPHLVEAGPLEVRRTAHAFNRMRARIRAEVAERTRTLAAISHDLRAPLTRMRLRVDELGDVVARRALEVELGRMERLLDAGLAFLRDQNAEAPQVTVDLPSLLQTICDEAGDLGREVRYAGPDRLTFSCRHDDIVRAVGNLVANALDFGSRIVVRLGRHANGVVIEVEDDGPGIPAEERERVFQPFYRGDPQRDPGRPGFGLGLSIVRSIVEAHGGTIELRDRHPTGTIARLVLQARRNTPSDEKAAPN
ncbi:MAG: HAMP domain-containing sensor histidine kinase [Geminicoccaceae bacterium]